jgi:transposase
MTTFQLPTEAKALKGSNGVTYIFFDYPYWNSGKSMGFHNRLYIGKLIDGVFVPNLYYSACLSLGTPGKPTTMPTKEEQSEVMKQNIEAQSKEVSPTEPARKGDISLYYGAVYLLEQIGGELTGVEQDLAECFPDNYKQLLSLIYYLILTDYGAFYRFEHLHIDHKHPYGKNIPSQRISDLLIYNISEEQKNKFFKQQANRRIEDEYLAYDTTSISSMSTCIKSVKWGRNKDEEKLPQVNLAMVVGEKTRLPVFYRILPGNISDVSTLTHLIDYSQFFEIKLLKFVLDRGFYYKDNINLMYKNDYDFIIPIIRNIKCFNDIYNSSKAILSDFKNELKYFNVATNTFAITTEYSWNYEEFNKMGTLILKQERQMYVHTYYNPSRGLEERIEFYKDLNYTCELLKKNMALEAYHQSLADKYIIIKKSITGDIENISLNEEAALQNVSNFGFFVLLSNKNSSTEDVLQIYRNKDIIEKAFENLKDCLDVTRTEVHSVIAFNNKIFLCYVALIYISYIEKKLKNMIYL